MRTNDSHEFHGITLRNDGFGWTIQLKLLGKYRQLRTYAPTAEVAAHRHDVALSKLEGFAEPSALPNFPEAFSTLSISRDSFAEDEGGLCFFNDLLALFSLLCKEAEAVGLDPVEMAGHRKELAKRKLESKLQKLGLARLKFAERLFQLRGAVPSLGLSVAQSKQLDDQLSKVQELFGKP